MGREWSGDHFPRQHPPWPQDRFTDQAQDDNRYPDAHDTRRLPIPIDKALREHCNIPAKAYFVGVVLDNGATATFSGPAGRIVPSVVHKFFDEDVFARCVEQVESGVYEDQELGADTDPLRHRFSRDLSGRRLGDRRRVSGVDTFDNELAHKTRKRPRSHVSRAPLNEENDAPISIATTKRPLRIGDSDMIWNFYQQRFKNCQQTACKLIAKAWVKAVEPKKQSNHPYTGKDEKAPDWWPRPWGPSSQERVRHKEPDHLYKKERVHLLTHILRLIVEPTNKQYPAVEKSGLNVKKLEEVTAEALSGFFSDPDNQGNRNKRPYLNEIFKVARYEERFKNGEIDGDTNVFVMADDKLPEFSQGEPEGRLKIHEKHDEEEPGSARRGLPSPRPGAPHPMMPNHSGSGSTVPSGLSSQPFLSELPVRGGTHLSTQMVHTDMNADQQPSFVENASMSTVGGTSIHHGATNLPMSEILTSPHDGPDRRQSFVFSPSTDFPQAPANTTMYSQAWQSSSAAPAPAPLYTSFGHQQTPSTPTYGAQPTMGLQQSQQQYMSQPYDPMARAPSFDASSHGHIFRSGVNQGGVGQTQGYTGYIPSDTRGMASSGISAKVEPLSRPQMQ